MATKKAITGAAKAKKVIIPAHAVSVVALTFYDMLKPIDKEIEIKNIKLLEKKGGKSDKKDHFDNPVKTAVLVCSDSISKVKKKTFQGKLF